MQPQTLLEGINSRTYLPRIDLFLRLQIASRRLIVARSLCSLFFDAFVDSLNRPGLAATRQTVVVVIPAPWAVLHSWCCLPAHDRLQMQSINSCFRWPMPCEQYCAATADAPDTQLVFGCPQPVFVPGRPSERRLPLHSGGFPARPIASHRDFNLGLQAVFHPQWTACHLPERTFSAEAEKLRAIL